MSVDLWRGEFGDSYHRRNQATPDEVRPIFEEILAGIPPGRALELGCGTGANLAALKEMGWQVHGIDVNRAALLIARARERIVVAAQPADKTTYRDAWFDLVFTAGLLIHIPSDQIDHVLEEAIRVSRRYLLAIEYAAPVEIEQEYRGHRNILWRRPYGKLYQYKGLKLVRHLDDTGLFYDGAEAWLLEKP